MSEELSRGNLGPGQRNSDLLRMETEPFDVVVIGAGVTGAGTALDAATSRYWILPVPTSGNSSARNTTSPPVSMSRVKKSAIVMGNAASIFCSEPTDGLTLSCSIRETIPLVTPALFASSL